MMNDTRRELLCEKCSNDYPVWAGPNDLWNLLAKEYQFLCPTCFALILEKQHNVKTVCWKIMPQEHESPDLLK